MFENIRDYNRVRLTAEIEEYLASKGADVSGGLPVSQYCLGVPMDEYTNIVERPLRIHRYPVAMENRVHSTLDYYVACITGDPISKLAEYENIHLNPAALEEIYDEYAKLMQNTCYECDLYGTKDCKYPPKWGQQIRINCPFFRHQLTIEEGGVTD